MAFNAGAAVGKLRLNTGGWVSGLVKAEVSTKSFSKKATSAFKSVTRSVFNLKNLLITGLVGVGFRTVIRGAVKLENSLLGLSSVAKAMGENMDDAKKAAISLAKDGLITVEESAQGLKNLLAIEGIGLDKAVAAMDALKDSAAFNRQGQLGFGEAVVGATQGLKNQLSTLVDNAGITKNLSVLQREYAASIGKSVGKLTELEKNLANVDGVIRESKIFSGDAAKALDTLGGQLTRVGTGFDLFIANLIDTKGPIKDIVKFVGDLLENINALGSSSFVVESLRITFEEFRKSLQKFTSKLPQMLVEGFVIGLKAVVNLTITAFSLLLPAIGNIFIVPLGLALGQMFLTGVKNIGTMFKNLGGNIGNVFFIIVKEIQILFLKMINNIIGALPAKVVKQMGIELAPVQKKITELSRQIKGIKVDWDNVLEGTKTAAEGMREIQPIIDDFVAKGFSQIMPTLEAFGQDFKDLFADIFDSTEGQIVGVLFENIKTRMSEMIAAAKAAKDEMTQALGGGAEAAAGAVAGPGSFASPLDTLFKINDDDFNNAMGKMNALGFLTGKVGKSIESSMTSLASKTSGAMITFGKAFAAAAASGESFGSSLKIALKTALTATLESIAAESATQAIFQTALGLSKLALGDVKGAGLHFASAALHATIAGVAGAAASSVGGGAGGGTAGGASGVGSSFTGSTDIGSPFDEGFGERDTPQSSVNITLRAEGFVDEEAMARITQSQIIPIINELVLENDQVLVSTNSLADGRVRV